MSGLIERLEGPHEWGYRDPVEGGFILDGAPFEAADELERLSTALAAAERERDEARDRVEELEQDAERVSEEFEGDCWKAVRRLLKECHYEWDSEGVTAEEAADYISTTLDEMGRDAATQRARAIAAEAREKAMREVVEDIHTRLIAARQTK